MNTSLSWIKEYVPDLECTDQEYMDAMTLSGTKCEGYKKLDEDLDKIVYPVMVKPVDNGGGVGMTVANNEEELIKGVQIALDASHSNSAV